jgi:YVTN family beta-propeller protein
MLTIRVAQVSILLLILCSALTAQSGMLSSTRTQTASKEPPPQVPGPSFINFETPHVHPLELTPDGSLLLAANTPDNRLEIFDPTTTPIRYLRSVPVGLEPVTVRAYDSTTAWVVNHLSDSVSIVDLTSGHVVSTLFTDDEPADVVFAGTPWRAFVSCSQANIVNVFDPADLTAPPLKISLLGEDPRALAVSPDGKTVYVAIFESGNGTTILGGGSTEGGGFPQNAVSDVIGPYQGINPPPNENSSFTPPLDPGLPTPPPVGLIIKQNHSTGAWLDDNGHDWTDLTSGVNARFSGRPYGWKLLDHDIALIDTESLAVSYVNRLMNLVMALAVNPVTGMLTAVGTDATNEIRYESNLTGTFLRVTGAQLASPSSDALIFDLNPHLDYTTSTLPQAERNKSVGDPRQVVWDDLGQHAYVAGMGSDNVIIIDASGNRVRSSKVIRVGKGPSGLALLGSMNRLFVLNKFDNSISTVDTNTQKQAHRQPFFDPTPNHIKHGRKFLYNTHDTSGLGQLACGSCHVDARTDRLAWDLGDPAGAMASIEGQNLGMNNPELSMFMEDFHPMKGPMVTQTLQDIIGKEPLHWRGDKNGLEDFNGAFTALQGDDAQLTDDEMQAFEDFLSSIYFPPNPFRNLDNSFKSNLDLPGHFTTGKFSPEGLPLPPGNAKRGKELFVGPNGLVGGQLDCITCHTSPTGLGSDTAQIGEVMEFLPAGPNGEHHHALVGIDGSTNKSIKIAHLRNLYEKVGMDMAVKDSRAGFGFLHDGSVDSLARFVSKPTFELTSDQEIADMVAFLLSYSGGGLPRGSLSNPMKPLGPMSQDTHPAVGQQTTMVSWDTPAPGQVQLIQTMMSLAENQDVGLVVRGPQDDTVAGWIYLPGGLAQSNRASQRLDFSDLLQLADVGHELTLTLVPKSTEVRIGLDRDNDGTYDGDELDAGTNPLDPLDPPGNSGKLSTISLPPSTPRNLEVWR